MSKDNINIDDIKVPFKLDDVIKDAVDEGYSKYNKYDKKHRKLKRSITIAAAMVLIVVGIGFSDDVIAAINLVKFNIEDYLGMDKSLENYKTVVNKSITKNGVTVQLNEVILDGDEIIVATTENSDKELDVLGIDLFESIYINGKKVSKGAGGSSKVIDKNTQESVMAYDLKSELSSGKLEIEIKYDKANCIYSDGTENDVRGPWSFKFVANGDELTSSTYSIELNNCFQLEDGQKITLNEYRSNDVGQKIYFSIEGKEKAYDILLKGYDNLGNEVEFYNKEQSKFKGIMKNQSEVSEEAEYLKLTPYAVAYPEQSGRMSNDFKKVGEEFTIKIK